MDSLVLELQKDALDRSVTTVDLLRKALVVARKLKVTDIVEWLSYELNGYPEGVDVPDYRVLRGELKVHNPYNGWIPLMMENAEHANLLSKRATSQSISELEKISEKENGLLYVKLPKIIETKLMKSMTVPLEPAVFLSNSQVCGLIERIRNTVLEWALGLEEQGITGEGMSFSSEEKKQAGNVTLHVEHLGSFIGSMNDSQLQQGTSYLTQSYTKTLDLEAVMKIVEQLREKLDQVSMSLDSEAQIKSDLICVETQLASPKPNVTIIKESLHSTRSILEGLASSAIFQRVISAINLLG